MKTITIHSLLLAACLTGSGWAQARANDTLPVIDHQVDVGADVNGSDLVFDTELYSVSNTFRIPELTLDGWKSVPATDDDIQPLPVNQGKFDFTFQTQNKKMIGVDFAVVVFRIHIKSKKIKNPYGTSLEFRTSEDCRGWKLSADELTGLVEVRTVNSYPDPYVNALVQTRDGQWLRAVDICLPIKQNGQTKLNLQINRI